jgi:hypothetical protein
MVRKIATYKKSRYAVQPPPSGIADFFLDPGKFIKNNDFLFNPGKFIKNSKFENDDFVPTPIPDIVSAVKIQVDPCNFAVQVVPYDFARTYPPINLLYRNSNCQLPTTPSPSLPLEPYEKIPEVPFNDSNHWLLLPSVYKYEQGIGRNGPPQGWAESTFEVQSVGELLVRGVRRTITAFQHNGVYADAFGRSDNQTPEQYYQERIKYGFEVNLVDDIFGLDTTYSYGETIDYTTKNYYFGGTREELIKFIEEHPSDLRDYRRVTKSTFRIGSYFSNFFPFRVPGKYPKTFQVQGYIDDFYGRYFYNDGIDIQIRVAEKKINIIPFAPTSNPEPSKISPPPPPLDKCCKDMACCPDSSELESLLRLILKKIGASDLPATVPKVLTDKSKGTTSINNLAQFTSYTVKQLDALCGKYPIEVKIKDANLTEEGDQSQTIKIPNIAEGIAELLGLLLILKSESGATLSAAIRGMIEAGSAKQSAILAHDYAKANSEFLAYKGKQVKHQVPFAFDFNKQKLQEMLKEGTFDVKGFEIDDKNDINDLFAPVLEMAAMYRTANFRNLGASNPAAALKTILTGYINFNSSTEEAIKKPNKENGDAKPEENWDDFLRSAEQGFIQEPGIKNNTEPYDRPFDQRPKIREIGNDTSDFED